MNPSPACTTAPTPSRLLNLGAAATYLSVSPWTVRELEWKGVLSRICVPLPNGGELRKRLFDKAELDWLIEAWKETVLSTPMCRLASVGVRPSAPRAAMALSPHPAQPLCLRRLCTISQNWE
jgi:hypothetical protein